MKPVTVPYSLEPLCLRKSLYKRTIFQFCFGKGALNKYNCTGKASSCVPNLGLVLELEKQVIHGIDLPEENA
jgi:hypothetical protein